jgi:hypothetical protein
VSLFALVFTASAEDIPIHLPYVCNGERLYVDSCNIRDLSDTSTCMVGHPDRPLHNGFTAYTYETRGALKKLLPTCQQPSAKQIAAHEAFQKKQQEIENANAPKPTAQSNAGQAQAARVNIPQPRPPQTPEQRRLNRCITSGRLPATCTGNSLLGAFGQMVSQVLPSAAKEPAPGPTLAGVFQGAGKWRLDFIDGGVLVNCSILSPNQQNYTVEFKNNRAILVVDTNPKPLVLSLGADGTTMTAPGPVTIDGVIASGYDTGLRDASGRQVDAATSTGPVFNEYGQRTSRSVNTGHSTFSPKRVTCPALNLSSKGAGAGIQTMQTDLLKSIFNDGDKGPPTPPGIRMHGIFAASTGFSVEFFPESAILGCGADAARAYPYTVVADGTKSFIKIDAPDHPLTLAFKPDGSLDAGSGPYQVHGRAITGTADNGDFTFAPLEQTCNLAVLTASKTIPSGAAPATATVVDPAKAATLEIVSALTVPAGQPNPLAGHPYILLRDSFANTLAKAGIAVPQGMSPFRYLATACASRGPDCQRITDAVKANSAAAIRGDATGHATISGVAPGTYHLIVSTRYNNQPVTWDQPIELKTGPNSLTLDPSNAVPAN